MFRVLFAAATAALFSFAVSAAEFGTAPKPGYIDMGEQIYGDGEVSATTNTHIRIIGESGVVSFDDPPIVLGGQIILRDPSHQTAPRYSPPPRPRNVGQEVRDPCWRWGEGFMQVDGICVFYGHSENSIPTMYNQGCTIDNSGGSLAVSGCSVRGRPLQHFSSAPNDGFFVKRKSAREGARCARLSAQAAAKGNLSYACP